MKKLSLVACILSAFALIGSSYIGIAKNVYATEDISTFSTDSFSLASQVRPSGETSWSGRTNQINANPGDTLDIRLIYSQIGTTTRNNVKLISPLPTGLEYVVGSATIRNASTNNIDTPLGPAADSSSGNITTNSVDIGNYNNTSTAFLTFSVKVADINSLPNCGSNYLVSTARVFIDSDVQTSSIIVSTEGNSCDTNGGGENGNGDNNNGNNSGDNNGGDEGNGSNGGEDSALPSGIFPDSESLENEIRTNSVVRFLNIEVTSDGKSLRVNVGHLPSRALQVYFYSSPIAATCNGGECIADAEGFIVVTLPQSLPTGLHTLAIYSDTGVLLGFARVEIESNGVSIVRVRVPNASAIGSGSIYEVASITDLYATPNNLIVILASLISISILGIVGFFFGRAIKAKVYAPIDSED
ncbi:hypothetical protein FWH09_02690 [Candidatus Saccharibacteria bacterium]|nr:hypothetical protein [Candidatus Saccharibacteria bacterium]